MIPRFAPDYDWQDLLACLLPASPDSVQKLEQAFAQRAGHADAIALRYGRSGLYYLLRALGLHNRRVIMPSYTCVVVAHAVVASGNIPVFLDNEPGQFQPPPQAYLAAVETAPQDVAMIIPTHLFGIAEETEALYRAIRAQYPHVFVLQDGAHGYFARDDQGHTVTTWGDGTLFGLNISKLVNSVRGGMLTLRDPQLARTVRQYIESERASAPTPPPWYRECHARLYAFAAGLAFTPWGYELVYRLTRQTRLLARETNYYDEHTIELPNDFQQPMSAFEAAIGQRSLARYDQRIQRRQQLARAYVDRLSSLRAQGKLKLIDPKPGFTWSHFPIWVPPGQRDAIRHRLEREARVEIGIIVDYSVAELAAYRHRGHAPTPIAAAQVPGMLNLPLCLYENRLGLSVRALDQQAEASVSKIVTILQEELD